MTTPKIYSAKIDGVEQRGFKDYEGTHFTWMNNLGCLIATPMSKVSDLTELHIATPDDVMIKGHTKEEWRKLFTLAKLPRSLRTYDESKEVEHGLAELIAQLSQEGKEDGGTKCVWHIEPDSKLCGEPAPDEGLRYPKCPAHKKLSDSGCMDGIPAKDVDAYLGITPSPTKSVGTVEITLTEEERKDLLLYLKMAKAQCEEKEFGLIHEERIDSLAAILTSKLSPMPEPTEFGTVEIALSDLEVIHAHLKDMESDAGLLRKRGNIGGAEELEHFHSNLISRLPQIPMPEPTEFGASRVAGCPFYQHKGTRHKWLHAKFDGIDWWISDMGCQYEWRSLINPRNVGE
jgi:hypothetical protein